MVDECVSCETDDELLFTCSYCDERFCATHQFPHHACAGFGRAGEASDQSDRDATEWFPASALEGETAGATEPTVAAESARSDESDPTPVDPQPATVVPPQPSPRAESLSAGTWGGSGSLPAGAGEGVVSVRPMDSRRVVGGTDASAAPRTVGDWISRQTYLTLLVKVGVIALLVNSAFYGGMAVTLYHLLPFVL